MPADESTPESANLRQFPSLDAIERAAADWLALREEREFTPSERAAFDSWLAADPRQAAAVAELESAWRTFDRLRKYPRPPGLPADPDFFARARHFRRGAPAFVAAAAAIAVIVVLWRAPWERRGPAAVAAPLVRADTSQFLRLPDGSVVEMKAGSEVLPQFVPAERRVLLVRGEAHFTVAKNPARPFIVVAGGVAVRAVGTVFDVRLDASSVEVLVTEGKVQVNSPMLAASSAPVPATLLVAGECAVVATAGETAAGAPTVAAVAPQEIEKMLSWQASRLVFDATPLVEVVARFNRHLAERHGERLVLLDPELGAMRISGRFQADNVESFVELLETSFGVAAQRQGGEILLWKAP